MSYLENKTTLFITHQNSRLSARISNFSVKTDSFQNNIPLVKVLDIIMHPSVKVSKAAIILAAKHSIPIHYINNRGDYYGTFCNGLSSNIFLRKAQYAKKDSKEFVLDISKKIVSGKRYNQQWVLSSLKKNLKLPLIKWDEMNSIESILGCEGKIGAVYWAYFPQIIKNPEFEFKTRSKHPPCDEINALLSFGYTMLVIRITSILFYLGLDPYFGFYHKDFYKRPNLALDLMEEWRPIAVDKFVVTLINRKEIKKDDFERKGRAVILKQKARNEFIKKWYEWWNKKEFYSGLYKTKATLSKFCEWQCRKFSKVIIGEIEEYRPFKF